MTILSFNLLRRAGRPIFTLKLGNRKCTCMLDTGALVPVFCKGVHNFIDTVSNLCDVSDLGTTTFHGIGKEPIQANLFQLSDFAFEDNRGNCVHYKNFKVLVILNDHLNFDFLLPDTMFRKMEYKIDYISDIPTFKIRSPKEVYYSGFTKENGPLYTFLTD